jgi:hypothetical protein
MCQNTPKDRDSYCQWTFHKTHLAPKIRVGSGSDFCKFRRVGSRNLNIFIHVFRKLQDGFLFYFTFSIKRTFQQFIAQNGYRIEKFCGSGRVKYRTGRVGKKWPASNPAYTDGQFFRISNPLLLTAKRRHLGREGEAKRPSGRNNDLRAAL